MIRHLRTARALVPAALGLALALAGCSGDVTTQAEALRIVSAGLPQAVVGQPYDEAVHAVGGLRPYEFSLVDGSLPPGLALEAGALRGTPTQTGAFAFTVQVSDANLSKTVQRYALQVVEVPPPRLTLQVPQTQVQRRITLRARLEDALGFTGLRTELTWDAAHFRLVDGSVRASRSGLALLQHAEPGKLQVALVPLGRTLDGGSDLFSFDLEPTDGASYLRVTGATEYAGDTGHHYDTLSEGRSAAPEGAPAGAAPPSSGTGDLGTGLPIGTPPGDGGSSGGGQTP